MMKKAIIHIGGHKTGTTSIQKNLLDNAELLNKQGINYPKELLIEPEHLFGQHSIPWYLINKQFKLGKKMSFQAEEIIDFFQQVQNQQQDVLLSSEEFIWLESEHILRLKELLPDFEFYIILYVRRQDEAAPALYQTHVIYSGIIELFETWMENKWHGFDYFSIINRWIEKIQAKVIVRSYEKSQLIEQDVVKDFEFILNQITNKMIKLNYGKIKFNQTIAASVTGLIRYYNTQPSKAKMVSALLELGKELQKLSPKQKDFDLIAPSIQKKILEQFSESNLALSQQYLGIEKLWFDSDIIIDDKEWQNNHFMNGGHLLALINHCLEAINILKQNNLRLESEIKNVTKKNIVYKDLQSQAKKLNVDNWINVVAESTEQDRYLADVALPSVPPPSKQAIFHGTSGKVAIKSAVLVYKYVLNVCQRYQVTPIETLLDFGCGWGRFTRLFVRDVETTGLFGIDPWTEAIQMCRQHMPYASFIQSALEPPLIFQDNFFQVVFANSVFSHLSEASALAWIQEIGRILRPGGLLIATTHPRNFLIVVQEIKQGIRKVESDWHQLLEKSAIDIDQALCELDQGQFIHIVTGQNNGLYGDSCVPKAYIERVWGEHLELLEFIDDQTQFPQATFVLRKRFN